MTKREHLRKKVGRVMGAASLLATAAVISLILSQLLKTGEAFNFFFFFFLAAPLFIAAIASILFITFFVQCPDCKKPIGLQFLISGITATQKWVNRADWGANNCPHCGTDLNLEMREK